MSNNKRTINESLQHRFALAILVATLLATLVFTALTVAWQYRLEWAQIVATFDEIKKNRVGAMAEALHGQQAALIQQSMQRLVAESNISRAMVWGEDGRIFAQADGEGRKNAGVRLEQLFDVASSIKVYPLMDPTEPRRRIGTLAVEFNTKPMVVRLLNLAARTFLIRGSELLILALISIWVLQKLIMQHLRRIAEHLQTLAAGSISDGLWLNRPSLDHPDEFDGMVTAVNTLAERLGQLQHGVEELPSEREGTEAGGF